MAIQVTLGWVGFKKSYIIKGVGQGKILCLLTRWVGGSKKGPKHAYVIYEWSHKQTKHFTLDLIWPKNGDGQRPI